LIVELGKWEAQAAAGGQRVWHALQRLRGPRGPIGRKEFRRFDAHPRKSTFSMRQCRDALMCSAVYGCPSLMVKLRKAASCVVGRNGLTKQNFNFNVEPQISEKASHGYMLQTNNTQSGEIGAFGMVILFMS
jgi:hypothetical protein